MNTTTSNHIQGKSLRMGIYTTPVNTTSYYSQQTMGAEYGTEAETLCRLFDAAPDMRAALKGILSKITTLSLCGKLPEEFTECSEVIACIDAVEKAGGGKI